MSVKVSAKDLLCYYFRKDMISDDVKKSVKDFLNSGIVTNVTDGNNFLIISSQRKCDDVIKNTKWNKFIKLHNSVQLGVKCMRINWCCTYEFVFKLDGETFYVYFYHNVANSEYSESPFPEYDEVQKMANDDVMFRETTNRVGVVKIDVISLIHSWCPYRFYAKYSLIRNGESVVSFIDKINDNSKITPSQIRSAYDLLKKRERRL